MATIGPFKLHSTAASAALTGTLTAGVNEADIVTGGKTLIITLTGATWVAAGATFDAQRQAIIDGIDSAQAEATGWDTVVRPAIDVGDVVRTSDTVVTITLPAVASYDITADETLTVTVPASATSSASAIVAAPTVVIAAVSAFDLLMVLTPIDYVSSNTINVNADFEVDWGDGVFVPYIAGDVASQASNASSGLITVRSTNAPTTIRVKTNTISAADVQTCNTLTSLNLSFFNLSNLLTVSVANAPLVTSAINFCRASGVHTVSLGDMPLVTSFQLAFAFCASLSSFSIGSLGSLTSVSTMFQGCQSLVSLPLFDTSTVTDGTAFLISCTSLSSVPLFDFSSLINASQMFSGCQSLTTVPAFNTSSVTNFTAMFAGSGVISVPALATNSATTFNGMFSGCTSLRCIAGLDTTPVVGTTNKSNMFNNCYQLKHPVPRDTVGVSETDPLISSAGSSYTNGSPGDCNDFFLTGDLFGRIGADVGDSNQIAEKSADPEVVPSVSSIAFAWQDQSFSVNAWTLILPGLWEATFAGHESELVRLQYHAPSFSGGTNGIFYIEQIGFLDVVKANVNQVGRQGVKIIYV